MNFFDGIAQGLNRKTVTKTQLDLYKTKLCPSFQQVLYVQPREPAIKGTNASSHTAIANYVKNPIY